MEPPGATIHIDGDRVKLIASLQSPGGASRMISAMTGMPRLNIDIELPRSGGGFGRRLENDFVAEAVLVAQAVGKPVKLLWTRDDDCRTFLPSLRCPAPASRCRQGRQLQAGRIASPPPRASDTAPTAPTIRTGWARWTSMASRPTAFLTISRRIREPGLWFGTRLVARLHTFASFATQSFVDEVAAALKRDPLELRLEMLGAPRDLEYREHGGPVFNTGRLAGVLSEAARRIGYGRTLPKGRGIGLACHFTFGGYAAHAIEVASHGADWRIERCVCVADVGVVVNPAGVEAQLRVARSMGCLRRSVCRSPSRMGAFDNQISTVTG